MPGELNISVDTQQAAAKLGVLGGAALSGALATSLAAGAQDAGAALQEAVLEAGLLGPTGSLAGTAGAWPDASDELGWYIGVPDDSPARRYAWLITGEVKTIVPKGHRYLAIPIGENLTGAGDARFSSPRDVVGLVFRGRTAGIVTGDDYTPLFALVESVTIAGRNVLEPTVEQERTRITESVQQAVDELVAKEN